MTGAGPRPPAAVKPARQQFYVTHCARGDSVLGNPGWSVRAASAADPELARRALDYPPYELPMELWAKRPTRDQAPRRLARVKDPGGGVWVVHSSYLEKDTMNRDRSYFTHLLLLPPDEADPAAVLRSWAGPDWATDYPGGRPKELAPPGPPAAGAAVGDDALAEFLADAPVPDRADPPAVATCPDRLRADPDARRGLLARFLRGVVAAASAPDPARARLFVHAEPGLLALLLYGAARLLPPGLAADLTFTTFEPAHRNLRDYKRTLVVGTFLGNPAKPLDPDLLAARGLGLNAFDPARSSPELVPPPAEFADLMALAAGGEWEVLRKAHELLGRGRVAPARAAEAVRLARAIDRLDRGEAGVADLLALARDRDGQSRLAAREELVWPVIRDAAPASPEVRQAFRDRLRQPARLDELRGAAVARLMGGDVAGWRDRWAVIREVADPPALAAQVEGLLAALAPRAKALGPDARAALRAEGRETRSAAPFFDPLHPAELDAVLDDPGLPADWKGYALAAAVAAGAADLRDRAHRRLADAPPEVLAGCLRSAPHPAELVARLFDRPGGDPGPLLGKVIRAGARVVPAADWLAILERAGPRESWDGLLLPDDRLFDLLKGAGGDPAAGPLWARFLGPLGPGLLTGDRGQRAAWDQLWRAAKAAADGGADLKGVMPTGAYLKLRAANLLVTMWADPAAVARARPEEIERAFDRFGLGDLADGLRRLFEDHYADTDPAEHPGKLEAFLVLFEAVFPTRDGFDGHNGPLDKWLWVVQGAPGPLRAAFQWYYAERGVPNKLIARVLDHPRPVELIAQVRMRLRRKV